jgi:biotin transport system substrate-specific component
MKNTVGVFAFAALVGMAINYLFGTNWMYAAYKIWAAAPDGFTYKLAWLWMVVPLPKDIILAILAGVVGHRLKRTLSKSQFRNVNNAS